MMSEQIRRVEAAILGRIRPRRSMLIATSGVIVRAGIWALLIFALAMIVPRVIPALRAIQPRMPPPRGPVMDLVNFLRIPQQSVPVVAGFLLFIDLPVTYLSTGSFSMRRWWSRLMIMVPLGIGLAAGVGFVVMYLQLIGLLVKDAGLGG
jgi:hypothetical protein